MYFNLLFKINQWFIAVLAEVMNATKGYERIYD